jgi:hypothetical protein
MRPHSYFEFHNRKKENIDLVHLILSAAVGCNTAIDLLGSTEQAKSALYYLIKYVTKNPTELANTISVIFHCQRKIKEYPYDAGSPERNALYLLNKIINALSSQSEVSAMMASASLLGMPARMSSHTFWYCFIWPAIRYLKGRLVNRGSNVHLDENDEDDENLGDLDDSNEEFGNEDIFDESVLLRTKGEGCQLFQINDEYIAVQQHVHYMYRGELLAMYNFYEYCGLISIKAKISGKRKWSEDGISGEIDSDDERETIEETKVRGGRTFNAVFNFDSQHSLFQTHVQCLNSKIKIPILAGYPPPSLPARNSIHNKVWIERSNKFAEYYIALMVPWSIESYLPPIQYNYEGLCHWQQRNNVSDSVIHKYRNLSINVKATSLRVDAVKKKIMNIWRGRSSTT